MSEHRGGDCYGLRRRRPVSEKPVSWDAVYVLIIMTLVYSMSVADRFIGSILIEPINRNSLSAIQPLGF